MISGTSWARIFRMICGDSGRLRPSSYGRLCRSRFRTIFMVSLFSLTCGGHSSPSLQRKHKIFLQAANGDVFSRIDWVLETFPVFFLKHTKWAKFAGQRDSVRGRRTVATAPAATAISRTRVSSDEADETAYKKEPIVTATAEDLNGSMHQRSSPSESETQEQQSRAPLLPSTDNTV